MKSATLLAVLMPFIGACSGPIEPSRISATVDPRAARLVAMLDAIDTPLPWNGETFAAWRERLAVPIRVEPLPAAFGAVWNGSAVVINADLAGYDDAGQAALIAHELRHADGIAHDCGPYQDRRSTAWSAYDVQIWTLLQFGKPDQAIGNESGYCD